MNNILNYMEENQVFFGMMLAVMILAAFFLYMYRREKRRADRTESSVPNERRFYQGFAENQKECIEMEVPYCRRGESDKRYGNIEIQISMVLI